MNFNKFNLITGILFVVAFILVLLNFLSPYLNLSALIIFIVASIMLSISLFKYCIRKNAYLTSDNEEIIMELSIEEGKEQYIPVEKKQTKFRKFLDLIKIFSPFILSSLFALCLIAFLVLSVIKLF